MSRLKNFKDSEFNQIDMMNELTLSKIDAVRDFFKCPVIITSSFRENDNGEHGKGNALDIIILTTLSLFDQYLALERFGFAGLGIYPHWKHNKNDPDEEPCGGFHVDERDLTDMVASRWMAYLDDDGVQKYTALTYKNLINYGVIL
jgi:hypothetical protein